MIDSPNEYSVLMALINIAFIYLCFSTASNTYFKYYS
jgi:hypothetical protein